MSIFTVSVNREESHIHKVCTKQGKLNVKSIKGDAKEQAEFIAWSVLNERPKKIVIEKAGFGLGVFEHVASILKSHGLKIGENSKIVYS
ncbi:hypothetical protein ACDN41_12640 [Priestia aryabhattai]|uniref:hypothetical protein n=1 Tax=Priestia aryabhattai TaxID=412384 RepID=UPI003531D294